MNVALAFVKTHGKKSIHIKHERGYSLRVLTEKIYIPNFVTRSLQIDLKEKRPLRHPDNSYPRMSSHG
jgi:hypothetical protein